MNSLENDLKRYCENHEIRQTLTLPYSPLQNGVVERKNIIVLDMACSMLKTKICLKKFELKQLIMQFIC